MASHYSLKQENEDDNTITEERMELMVPSDGGIPTLRNAHFLKPLLNPKNQPLPELPSFSLSSKPNFKELLKQVHFKGRPKPQKGWKSWVDQLQKTHLSVWKRVGIFNAIRASTYKILRNDELVLCLTEKWCPETNTFMFSWGECTITLEDIMILGGYSVLGDHVLKSSPNLNFTEIKAKLFKACPVIAKKCNGNVSHYGWMEYFKGKGGELEHVALLTLWLSRYVFPTNYFNRIVPKVFSIAIILAMGNKIAFAPSILASIYKDLTSLREKIVSYNVDGVDDVSDLELWAPFDLVQVWAWERFVSSSPKPGSLSPGEPRVARWHNVIKLKTHDLRLEIELGVDNFIWRPFALCLRNWDFPKFYCKDGIGMWVLIDSDVNEELLSFVRCLRVSELVGCDCVMQYLPHRVGMQFGLDQDIPSSVPRCNADVELAWACYSKPVVGLKLYLPPRLFEGDVTVQYSTWWKSELGLTNDSWVTSRKRPKSNVTKAETCYSSLSEKDIGDRLTRAFSGSSSERMASQKPQNVGNEIASSTLLNPLVEREDVNAKDSKDVVNEVAANTVLNSLNEQEDDVNVNEPQNVVKELNPLEGSHSPSMRGSSVANIEAVNVKEVSVGCTKTEELCSALGEDNNVGKDAMEVAMSMTKQAYISTNTPLSIEGDDDSIDDEAPNLTLECRMKTLERLVSMYKAAKFGSTA
ncbi:unnamed protein product [Amaranthus hypochondriacus]